jgi:DNA-binding XRE family transcriptional regulator
MRLYEWAVASGTGAGQRVSPVGVTDEAGRARERMLEALGEVPAGVAACGWVTVMAYLPVLNGYDRYQTPVRAERDRAGVIRAAPQAAAVRVPGLADGRMLPGAGSPPCPARPLGYVVDGQRLRVLRRERGLSQEGLAYQAGVSGATVARLERQPGAVCRARTLARLAVALGEQAAALTAAAAEAAGPDAGHARG